MSSLVFVCPGYCKGWVQILSSSLQKWQGSGIGFNVAVLSVTRGIITFYLDFVCMSEV